MAFNPFHAFRKHQKVIMAGLVVVAMITFIFSFGPGDLFSGRQWGGWRNKGKLVTTLYGRKVYESDLSLLVARREMANDFLFFVLMGNGRNFPGAQDLVFNDVMTVEKNLRDNPQLADVVQTIQFARFLRGEATYRKIRAFQDRIASMMLFPAMAGKPTELAIYKQLLPMLPLSAWLSDPDRPSSDIFYFGGNRSTESLLDFQVWKHQADRLEITLGETEVIGEVNKEAFGKSIVRAKSFAADDMAKIFLEMYQRGNSRYWGFTASDLESALADEFRVAMAQEALLGHGPGVRAYQIPNLFRSPGVDTPDQFYDYYRSRLTERDVTLLDVPVKEFLADVKEPPTEAQLQDLFDRYKDQEPAPMRDQPGFKEPRKIRIESVVLDPKLFYFQKGSQMMVLAPPVVTRMAAGMPGIAVGAGPVPLAATIGTALIRDPAARAYDSFKSAEVNSSWFDRFSPLHELSLHGKTMPRPQAEAILAAAVAGLPTDGVSLRPAVTSSLLLTAAISQRENEQRSLILASTLGQLARPQPFGGPALAPVIYNPPVPDEATVRDKLLKQLYQDEVGTLVRENIQTMRKELGKRKTTAEKAAYVAEMIKTFGVTDKHFVMKDPKDQYDLEKDPALQAIKTAQNTTNAPDRNFARQFFESRDTGLYEVEDVFDRDGGRILWWRVQDDRAVEPHSLSQVRSKVVEAWRWRQARKLALAKADELAAAINAQRDKQTPGEAVKYLRDQKLGRFFDLRVARLTKTEKKDPIGRSPDYWVYEAYKPPVDDIAYPPDSFADKVAELKKPGEAAVVADRPKANFYVAVLTGLRPDVDTPEGLKASVDAFKLVYQNANMSLDPLWSEKASVASRRTYRQAVIRELRSDAGCKLDDDGQIALPLGARRSYDSSAESEG
jgi:hypothetical protein